MSGVKDWQGPDWGVMRGRLRRRRGRRWFMVKFTFFFVVFFDLQGGSGLMYVWISGYLGIWASGHLGFWASGYLGIWASGHLDFWASGHLGF